MKTLKLTKVLAVLSLSALASAQTETIPTLTLSGKVTNGPAISADTPITWMYNGANPVGTLSTSKNVEVKIGGDLISRFNGNSLESWKNAKVGGECNVSGVTVEDAKFISISRFYFPVGADQYYLQPAKDVINMDGTSTRTRNLFIYAYSAGAMKGSKICGGEVFNYDLKLQPGWNIVDEVITFSPSTRSWGTNYLRNARPGTSLSTPFMTFKVN